MADKPSMGRERGHGVVGRLLQARLLAAGCVCRQRTASGEMSSILPGNLRGLSASTPSFSFCKSSEKTWPWAEPQLLRMR